MPNRTTAYPVIAIIFSFTIMHALSLPVSLDKYWTSRIEQLISTLCNVDSNGSASHPSDPSASASSSGCSPCSVSDNAKNCCLSKEDRRDECWRNVINRLQLDDDVREGVYDIIQEKRSRNKSLGKRTPQKRQRNTFLGKRNEDDNELDEVDGSRADFDDVEKRHRNLSLGKRSRNAFLGKRGRNTFLGKRGYDGDLDDQNELNSMFSDLAEGSVGQQLFQEKRGRNTFLG